MNYLLVEYIDIYIFSTEHFQEVNQIYLDYCNSTKSEPHWYVLVFELIFPLESLRWLSVFI